MTARKPSPFPERLKYARELLGLTQNDLAVRLHVAKSQVSNYERGIWLPSLTSFTDICLALDVPADWMIGRDR